MSSSFQGCIVIGAGSGFLVLVLPVLPQNFACCLVVVRIMSRGKKAEKNIIEYQRT
jgi:hypothetical protein